MTTNEILRDINATAAAHNARALDVLFDVSSCIDTPATVAMIATLSRHFDYVSDSLIDELIDDLS